MPDIAIATSIVTQSGGAAAPELPTDNLVARWHQGAGIIPGLDTAPEPDEVTVASWEDAVSAVLLNDTAAANQPRLPASTPTFEGDGSSIVHYLRTYSNTGLGSHHSHTIALSTSVDYAASGYRFIFECTAKGKTFRIFTNNGLLGFNAPGSGYVISAVPADGSRRVLLLTLDAVSSDAVLYDDTTQIASDASYDGLSEVSSSIAIGSSNSGAVSRGISGTINEVLIYSAVLDAATRAQLVAYLKAQYP